MKSILSLSLLLIASLAHADQRGPISSGGTNQVLEQCKSADNQIRFKISVVNGGLLAVLEDYSSPTKVLIFKSTVFGVNDGYRGDTMNVAIAFVGGEKSATVLVDREDPRAEPLVYTKLTCEFSVR